MFATDEWVTISSLATAAGTLILAVATFSSVRSANKSARVAERSFQLALRPILSPSRLQDPEQRIMFGDRHWVVIPGGQAAVEIIDGVIYLAFQVRNVGNGIAVIEAWQPFAGLRTGPEGKIDVESSAFRNQTRSLWIPPGDVGFWQGALRDESEGVHAVIADAVGRGELGVDLLYRDHDEGQWTISRFTVILDDDGQRWWISMSRHRSFDEEPPVLRDRAEP
jgi:hypothetical protein